jgi:hypothetical protein
VRELQVFVFNMENYSYFPINSDKLINAVYQRRALWDRADLEHCNARIINQMWAEVAEELNSTSDAVRIKWRSLRDGFTRRLKKIPVSTSDRAEVEYSNYSAWYYFRHLLFLKDQYIPHASSTDIPPNENENLRDDLTDTQDEGLKTLKHDFKRLCHEKEQITSHVSTVVIPLTEEKTLGEDQTNTGDGNSQISQHTFKGLCHEKVQISSHAGSSDLPPKGKKTLRDDQTDLRDGKLQSSQHSFQGLCHEKMQISSHASTAEIPPKEKEILRTDKSDSQVGGLETSKYSGSGRELNPSAEVPQNRTGNDGLTFSKSSSLPSFKRFCLQKGQLTSHARSKDIPPKENGILNADQTDSRDRGQKNSQFSGSGKELKPSAEVPKGKTGNPGLEFSSSSTLPDFNYLCPKKDRLTSHAGNKDLPLKKRKDFSGIQRDIKDGEVETSQHNAARKKLKPSAEVPEKRSDDDSTSPNFKHLCLQKNQFTSHADTKDLPSKKKKTSRADQTHSREKGLETSKLRGPGKDLKRSAVVPKTRTADRGLKFSKSSGLPNSKHLCAQTDRLTSHAGSEDLQSKKKKTLRADQTVSRVGELHTSQLSGCGKGLMPSAEVQKKGTGDPGLEFFNNSTLPNFKHLCLQKDQLKPHASIGHIPPKKNKTSRDNQTNTRDKELESSKIIKLDGASSDILDAKTEASGPVSPSEQQAALTIGSLTTKHSISGSYETNVCNTAAQTERQIQKVCEDEHKARDEDTSFFESLIPHTKGLSPARKMLLRIKTQELIYNFVYNKKK